MRVIHLYVVMALLIGTFIIVQSMTALAQNDTGVTAPQVNTATVTQTPVSRSTAWLSVVPNKTTFVAGETMTLQFTVTNKYDDPLNYSAVITQPVAITGPSYTPSDANYTYQQNQCWSTTSGGVSFPKVTGTVRVMAGFIGWDATNANKTTTCPGVTSTFDHPWRWSIGSTPLAPGASRVITGSVVLTQPGTYTLVTGLVKDWVGYLDGACNPNGDAKINVCGIDTTTITVVSPTASPTPVASSTRTRTNTRTSTNTRTNTSTRSATFTRTLSPTRTMTEVSWQQRMGRYRFNDNLGFNVTIRSAIDPNYNLSCILTTGNASTSCPETISGGVDGNALRFTGGQRLVPVRQFLLIGNATLSFWAKPTATGNEMNAFSLQSATSSIIVGFDNTSRFFCSMGASRLTAPASISDSNWNHYACTFDKTTRQRNLYINSELVATDTMPSSISGLFSATFGSNPTRNGAYYSGEIDEFSLYGLFFNISQIEDLYRYFITDPTRISPTRTMTSTFTPSSTPFPTDFMRTSMSARFLFNEAAGATSFVNASAATNPAICPAPMICPTAGASGVRFSNAVEFASGQSLKFKNALAITSSQPFVASGWIYPTDFSTEMVFISARNPAQPNKLVMGTTVSGEVFCRFGINDMTSTITIPLNEWTHVICSIGTDKKANLYINGAPADNAVFTVIPTGNMNVWMGMDGVSSIASFIGRLDEVAFFRTAITWNMAETIYDQYAAADRRSPTRSRTPSPTLTPSRTRTFTLTRTVTRTPSITLTATDIQAGQYPYPMPLGTSTRTRTNVPTATITRSITPSRSATSLPISYPYPNP